MTRKDYVLIAGAINRAVGLTNAANVSNKHSRQDAINQVIACITSDLALDNPNFDRERFIKTARGIA